MAADRSAKRKSVKGEARTSKTKGSKAGSPGRANKKNAKQPKKHRWLRVVVGLVVAAIIVVLGAFSWDRWLRFDDAADIQGNWQASGQAAVVVIDGKQMHLTDEVAYDYALDTWAKTIDFSFGKLSGSGTYRFSDDRMTLTIVEGGKADLVGDFLRMFGLGVDAESESDLPTTVFEKVANEPEGPSESDGAQSAGDGESEPEDDAAPGDGAADGSSDETADADGPSGEASGAGGGGADGTGDSDSGGSAGSDSNPDADSGSSDEGSGGDSSNSGGMLFDEINDRGVS